MTYKELVENTERTQVDEQLIAVAEQVYGFAIPIEIQKIISYMKQPIFVDEVRFLSSSEIIGAPKDLHTDFKALGLLPLVDAFENDFIVYCAEKGSWAKYNITEDCIFKERAALIEYFMNEPQT